MSYRVALVKNLSYRSDSERGIYYIPLFIGTKQYYGIEKWWVSNHNSTFVKVLHREYELLEELKLVHYFDVDLKTFNLKKSEYEGCFREMY